VISDIDFPVVIPDKESDDSDYGISREEQISEKLCVEIRRLRHSSSSYMDIAEEMDIDPKLLPLHIKGECECEHTEQPPIENDKPWEEKGIVEFLHQNKNCWHYTDIADCFGCHPETVKNWVGEEHHDLKIIEDTDRTSSQNVTRIHRIGILLEKKDSQEFIDTLNERLEEIRASDKSLQDRLKELKEKEKELEEEEPIL